MCNRAAALALVLLLAVATAGAAEEKRAAPGPIDYGPGRELCKLANADIAESSGLACGRANPGVFWTHNDSGDQPRLYALNAKGDDLATCTIEGATSRDWEDMASFTLNGKHYLLIGDVGDNKAECEQCSLYLVAEPALNPAKRGVRLTVKAAAGIDFRYDDGPHNCEAIAVDPITRLILLVSKRQGADCKVYTLPLPRHPTREVLVARSTAKLKLPTVSAMDVSSDGHHAIVLSYGDAYEFTKRPGELWKDAFSRAPRTVHVPARQQGESICYGPDGKTLYLTSEKLPTPLIEVPVVEAK